MSIQINMLTCQIMIQVAVGWLSFIEIGPWAMSQIAISNFWSLKASWFSTLKYYPILYLSHT